MMRQALPGLLFAFALCHCKKPDAPAPAPSASTSAEAPVASSSAASVSSGAPDMNAWFAGTWHGNYEAQRYVVEAPKNEGAREWKDDDGGAHSGDGKIELEVAASGAIHGSARGPLGAQSVSGEVDGDAFRIRFEPKEPGARSFHGFAVLKRDGDALKGRLQSSSGDSLTVRDAAVELEKGSAAAAGASAAPSASASGSASAGPRPAPSASGKAK